MYYILLFLDQDIANFSQKLLNEQVCQAKNAPILTTRDMERLEENQPLLMNDAFILFEDDDVNFVNYLIEELPHYEFCKRSELLMGDFEHKIACNLIEKRCRKLIIVISKNFLDTNRKLNKYLIDFTTAFQIGKLQNISILFSLINFNFQKMK